MGLKDRINDLGLKDRLRGTAAQATGGLAKGQAKLEDHRSRQSLNSQLQALGQASWVQHSGRAAPAQFADLLNAIGPSIKESEDRLGPLPWPTVPSDGRGAAAKSTPAPATPTAPDVTPMAASALVPDMTPAGPSEIRSMGAAGPVTVPTSLDDEARQPPD